MLRIVEIEYDGKVSLGKGEFGSVFRGKYDDRKVAVKKVALNQVTSDIEEKALQQLNHPCIIKHFHSENDNNFKYFAMELCAASLDQLFLKSGDPRKYKGPALPNHLEVFCQLASGLEYIHSKDLVYRDIKPSNVLIFIVPSINHRPIIRVTMKWADFGLSKFVNERGTCRTSEIKGTANYFAPELLKKTENQKELGRGTMKSDVFSFALVIGYLLLKGQHVYGFNYFCIYGNIWNKNLFKINKIGRSHFALDILRKMLKDDPNKRISSTEVVNELIAIGIKIAKIEDEFWKQYHHANNLDQSKMKFLIQNGINVNIKDNNGSDNTLHFMFSNNKRRDKITNEIRFFIRNGFDVNRRDNNGANALHRLCWNNSNEKLIDEIRLLTKKKINVNGEDNNGRNALHWLCRGNSSDKLIDAMKILIENGINVNGKDNNGRNALHWLCANSKSEKIIDAIKLLIQNGIDVNEKNNDEENALHVLCRFNSSEKIIDVIDLLIQNGIDVNEKNKYGKNALYVLCMFNESEKIVDVMQILMQNGIEVHEKNSGDCWNALHVLCSYSSNDKLSEAIQFLIQNGMDVNEKDEYGRNALHQLCCNYSNNENIIDAIPILIQNGIDVNEKNEDGWNALHLLYGRTSNRMRFDAMQLLIENGIQSNGLVDAQWLFKNFHRKAETLTEIVQLFERTANSN